MTAKPIRVGLVGAGYIATWHADAIRATAGVELAAICDPSAAASQGFAARYGVPAYASVAEMLAANICDAAHILTQPHLHHDLALECLAGGLHVFSEKPFATTSREAAAMVKAAKTAGRQIGVGHNFLALPAYERLKKLRDSGALGRISSAEINWHLPLSPLRAGPFGLWMLRDRRNLLLELGPHLFAFAHDLFGVPEILSVEVGHPIALPGNGGIRPQSWRILARAGGVELTFNMSMVEVTDDRSVTLRGSNGRARMDFAADTLIVARENALDLVVNPLMRELSQAGQHLREGAVNAIRQAASLNRNAPFGISFKRAISGFYAGIAAKEPDPRFSGASAVAVIKSIDAALKMLPKPAEKPAPSSRRKPKPTVMVIGGTGFIGQHLTRGLVAAGHDVRVVSRGAYGPFGDIAGHVETVPVDLADAAAIAASMQGIRQVYNLAKSMDKTWDAALENDVGTSDRIARAALNAGVERLIYTGTIASYDMSSRDRVITEATGFSDDMSDRNMYARSKAECERRLMKMHADDGLPVTIARPGIVLGAYGPLQHWGIGRWHGAGAVRVWGNGRNFLPFVLIEDVVAGLILQGENQAAIGQDFNLVGDNMWSARDYFAAIHAAYGARIRISSGHMLPLYGADAVKYGLKRFVLRKSGLTRPSLADWKSRAHLSPFDNARPKELLGWAPENNRARFAQKAVAEVNLFGF